MEQVINRSIARERMVAMVSSFFGLLGLVLVGIGVFGVAASTVSRRTNELGLRIALGAAPQAVIRQSLRDAVQVVAIGLVCGIALALAAVRLTSGFVSDLLFGLEPGDWRVLLGSAALMLCMSVLACLAPVVRALRIDPARAMRHQ
jgi:ABC-type antimicrobial peptide transport system permease subunit